MSAGLDASIVTPGSTAPDVSRTVPARLCAVARREPAPRKTSTSSNRITVRVMRENLLDAASGRTMNASTWTVKAEARARIITRPGNAIFLETTYEESHAAYRRRAGGHCRATGGPGG